MTTANEFREYAAGSKKQISRHAAAFYYMIFGFDWFTRRKDFILGLLFAAEIAEQCHE